jgi:hypothetical protein
MNMKETIRRSPVAARLGQILLYCSLFALAATLFAQADRGMITGTISDPGGAVIPSAIINARELETGAQYETRTTMTGNFTLASLVAGTYEVSVTAPGFNRYVEQGVRVQVAQTARLDMVLKVGAATESITVTAAVPMLKTESAEQSHNISREMFDSLPLNFGNGSGGGALRNPLVVTQLLPGAYFQPNTKASAKVNGSRSEEFKIVLDGQDATSPNKEYVFNLTQPSVDAVEEVTIQASNFAAEFGQVIGGLYNFTTRSGANAFHGSVYDYFVNEALNAGQPFTNDGTGRHFVQRNRRQDFGFNVGGPVLLPKLYNGRNRTFFFFNYEFYVDRKNQQNIQTVPTDAYRGGDFSGALTGRRLGTDPAGQPILENTVYDPATNATVNGLVVRIPFPGNKIPSSRFDPVAQKIQAMLPAANVAGSLINNWIAVVPNPKTSWVPSIKIDHNFSARFKLASYYQRFNTHQLSGPDGLPIPLTEVRQQYMSSQTWRMNASYSLRPDLLVALGGGIQRVLHPDSAPEEDWNYPALQQLGLAGSVSGVGFPLISGLSNSSFGGMSLSIGPAHGTMYPTTKPTATASVTWVRNNHTYKFGGDWRIDAFTNRSRGTSNGSFSFASTQTGLPSTEQQPLQGGGVGLAYASFLLGRVSSATVGPVRDPQFRHSSTAFYAQDTWKITRRLTVDYGLRRDYASAPHELWNRWSMFGPTVPNPAAGGLLGGTVYEGYGPGRCNCRFSDTYPYAFGPRLAVAYQILPKTVLRVGWGLVYSHPVVLDFFGGSLNGVGYNTLNFATTTYGEAAVLLKNGLQYNRADLYAATLNPGDRPTPGQTNSPGNLIDRHAGRPGRSTQINISLQREVTPNLVVEAAYVANRGVWLQGRTATGTADDPQLVDFNAMSAARLRAFGLDVANSADQSLLRSTIGSSTAASRGFNKLPYPGFPTTATVAQSLRPYPQFGGLTTKWAPLGNSWYDSLQVKVTKRYSQGLNFTVAFTWQKELGLGIESGSINDIYNRANQKSIQTYSIPVAFVMGFRYEIQKYGGNRLLRNVVGGWYFSGTIRYQSGMPIPVPSAQNNLSSLLFQSTRMNRVPGEPLYLKDLNSHTDPTQDLVLNPKAWSDPAQGQWGYASAFYNDYRGRRRPQEEVALGRTFKLRESVRFQVRGEFFNVFNRNYIGDPSSGNPLQTVTRNSKGELTGGFGYISTTSVAIPPRNAQLTARLEF